MELQELRTFLAIAEEGSVSAASRRIHMTQPAVTRQLTRLEKKVGRQLFDRHSRGVELTQVGARLLHEARELVGRADALALQMQSDTATLRQRLHIAVPEEGLGDLTSIVVAAYQASHPNVDVKLTATGFDAVADLGISRASAFDAAMWMSDSIPDSLEAFHVYGERVIAVVSPESDFGETASIDDLLRLRFPNLGDAHHLVHRLLLSDFRNGSRVMLTPTPITSASGVWETIASGEAIACATVGADTGGAHVRRLELDQPFYVQSGVIIRRDERRQHVRNLGHIAATVGRDLHRLVPQAISPTSEDNGTIGPASTF